MTNSNQAVNYSLYVSYHNGDFKGNDKKFSKGELLIAKHFALKNCIGNFSASATIYENNVSVLSVSSPAKFKGEDMLLDSDLENSKLLRNIEQEAIESYPNAVFVGGELLSL